MNRVLVVLLLSSSLIASGVLVSTAMGQDGTTDVSSVLENAESVQSAMTIETTFQYFTGVVIGAGIGILSGSAAAYKYWQRNIG
jgi:hypothetical protein